MSKFASIVLLAVFIVVLALAEEAPKKVNAPAPKDESGFDSSDSSSESVAPPTPNPHIKEDNSRYSHKFAPYMGFMIAVLILIFAVAGFIYYSKKSTEGTEYNPMA